MRFIFTFSVSDDCNKLSCRHGANCKVVGGLAKCECDFACADDDTKVCGSDGRTYENKCAMLKEQCAENRTITVIKTSACGELVNASGMTYLIQVVGCA